MSLSARSKGHADRLRSCAYLQGGFRGSAFDATSEGDEAIHNLVESDCARRPETSTPLTRGGIAHLFFESIHPFEDGKGSIGRAISEKALAQAVGTLC
jgi:hypothetical protein